jgi:uncharacterized protein
MTNSKARAVITATVGYMCLALSIWMYSMPNAAWFSKFYGHGIAMLYPLGIVLGVMGILSFIQGRGLDSIIFFGGTGLLWSMQLYVSSATTADAMDPRSYSGWYYFIWAVFFCYVWIGSFKRGIMRILFLLGLWLTLLAVAISHWGNLHSIMLVGGYLGLITAILAAITSAEEVISYGRKVEGHDPEVATT